MYFRIIQKYISRSKFTTILTTLLIAIAAMLVLLDKILVVNLSGAVDTLILYHSSFSTASTRLTTNNVRVNFSR